MFQKFLPSLASAVLLLASSAYSSPVIAQTEANNAISPSYATLDIPISNANETEAAFDNDEITHPPLRLTPDKSSILMLDRSAGSIIIGNPAHLNILADSANRLIVVPRAPGASFFTVLDKDGGLLMQRHVIVASPKEKYLRVRNTCAAGEDCKPTSIYYCPDMCHEIMSSETMEDSGAASGSQAAGPDFGAAYSAVSGSQDQLPPPPPPAETDISE